MKQIALFEDHNKLGAKFVDFNGYNMPIWYNSIKAEHNAVRNSVGFFDVSHMGLIHITGSSSTEFINYIITNDVSPASDGKAIYSLLCNDRGQIIDDLIIYKISGSEYYIIVNAGNFDKDINWINQYTPDFDIKMTQLSGQYSIFAVQGPDSCKILSDIFSTNTISEMDYYSVRKINYSNNEYIISRTGYTGELGYEIWSKNNSMEYLLNKLITLNTIPCGLGARDTLRIEAGYPLYGHEIDESINPFEANLGWVIKFNKDIFLGKNVLENLKNEPQRKIISGFILNGKSVLRNGIKIYSSSNEAGFITSGTFSFTLNQPIGIGYIEQNFLNDELHVSIRNKKIGVEKTELPFIKINARNNPV